MIVPPKVKAHLSNVMHTGILRPHEHRVGHISTTVAVHPISFL